MPGYKAHLTGGLITFIIVLRAATAALGHPTFPEIPLCFAASMIGSIFPDIDIQSKMQRFFYISASIILIVSLFLRHWVLFFGIALIAFIVAIIKHRGITHRLWFVITIPGVFALYMGYSYQAHFKEIMLVYLFFATGALSHLTLDKTVTKVRMLVNKR